ncbi:putative allantoinase 1 [Orchesella cincta]|uniref:allantoinase n=1 Tax=Orchesella cincta TaxID=48709 RepID=A0A1D2MV71_ORCCI|nr:putative allantoinase 1 [Orchesella cincta]
MQFLGKNLEGIYGERVLIGDELVPATIIISNGKITEIQRHVSGYNFCSSDDSVFNAGNNVVMPGIFDSHVHINEPGRTEWEGFFTATKAALAGGITTIIDMPLNSIPPTTTLENLEVKLKAANGKCHTDLGFWGGVVPGSTDSLKPMINKGVIGFKCFLIHSGVDEFPCVNEDEVDRALNAIKGTGAVLAFHAETDCGSCTTDNADPNQYSSFLASRPDEMELDAIKMVDRLCRKHKNVRCHIVHLSTARALPIISKLKEDGFPITVESCPHYLTLNPQEISDKQTQFKCCPPIRDSNNQNELWNGLKTGVIDMIVSDHSPCTADLKQPGEKNFMEAWGGISSVQFGLSIIWSQAEARGFNIPTLSRWMSQEPARLAGMSNVKGKLDINYDADIVIWNDEETFQVTDDIILYRNKITPYKGKLLKGKVLATILRGQIVYAENNFSNISGRLLVK